MKYKLLIVDVDGTLVGKKGTILPQDREALIHASRTGVRVSLSTGRVIKACRWIIDQLSLDGYHIFFDGAFAGDVNGNGVYAQPLKRKLVQEAIEFARQNDIYLELYTSTGYFVEKETWGTSVHHQFFGIEATIADLSKLSNKEMIIKGELFTSSPEEESEAHAFENRFQGRLRFSWATTPAYPGVYFVNVVAPEVSKGNALDALASYLHIPLGQTAAIGDGLNDIPLLSTAGLAIAMGNARDEVKAVADYVTLDVEHCGLAAAIDKYVLS